MTAVLYNSMIPFLVYLVLQIPVFFVGMCVVTEYDCQRWGLRAILKTYVGGQMVVWALLQILAVPMIVLKLRFSILYSSFIIIVVVFFVLGCFRFVRFKSMGMLTIKRHSYTRSPLVMAISIVIITLIVFQFCTYLFGQHLDQDDARWLAEANDALVYGDMMTRDVSTGEFLGWFDTVRDVTSPWPMLYAILAKTLHVNTSMAAHTLYAPVALLVSYSIYYLLAGEIFEKAESRMTFLLSITVINLFYAGTVYTQSVFSLVRIWQGKATVAAIIIPILIYLFVCINKRNGRIDWIRLAITSCGACLTSGMGVSLTGIFILVNGIYSVAIYKQWKRIPLLVLSIIPVTVFSLLYFFLKG